jgi:hypothetical protein
LQKKDTKIKAIMESNNNNLDNDSIIRDDDELHVESLVVPSSSLPLSLTLSLSRNTATTTTFAPPPQQKQQQRRHVDANNNNDEHHPHQDNANANANTNTNNLYLCNKCNLMLGRHRFPKKILRKIINRRISSSSNDEELQNTNTNTNARENTSTNANTNTNTYNINTKTATTATDDDATSLVLICHQCRKINGAIRMKQPKPKYTILTDSGKSNSGLTRRPNNWGYCNYLDQLFSMNCYTDIVKLKVFHSAKDISESMAAIYAIFHHSTHVVVGVDGKKRDKKGINGERDNRKGNDEQDNRNKDENKKVLCLCIGDGCTPRTAVLLSFLTKGLWDCVSIDPALSNEWSDSDHLDDSNNISSISENDSDSEKTQKQKQKQKQKQVVRGLYGYKGTLKEFVLDSNRPPFKKLTCSTASNNNDPHNNNNNNKQDGDNNNDDGDGNEINNDYYQHLILLCVHSHARFIDESTVDNIRSLYTTSPNPSSSSSSSTTSLYCNDINTTPNLNLNTSTPPLTSLLIPTTIVSLPCCPQYRHVRDIGIQPHIKYDDDCVFSACRSVEVWNL